MGAPQEVRGDPAGPGHGDQGPELKRHVGINDGHMGIICKHSRRGVERHPVYPEVAPQKERARRRRTHGQQRGPRAEWWRLGSWCGVHGPRTLSTLC